MRGVEVGQLWSTKLQKQKFKAHKLSMRMNFAMLLIFHNFMEYGSKYIYIYVDPWQSKNNLDWLSTKNYFNTFSGKVMLPLWLCSFLIILYHLQFQTIVCHATQLLFLKRMLKSINNNQITNNTIIWSLTSYRFNARKQGLCGSFKKRHKLDCVMKAEIWTGILIFLSFAA